MGTKVYNRAFLSDNGIKFNESLTNEEAELFFQLECFLKSKYFIYVQNACYIAPKNSLGQYTVAKFHDVSNDDAQIVGKFNRYFTAHIDVQLVPKTEGGDFPVIFVSDDRAKVLYKAGWTPKGTLANTIDSYTGKLKFIMKTTVDGQVNAFFRGLWVPTPEDRSKLIPYWVDYTKLTVNGKVIFDKLTPTWHRKPYIHKMDLKAGDEIIVEVEWLPHRSDT